MTDPTRPDARTADRPGATLPTAVPPGDGPPSVPWRQRIPRAAAAVVTAIGAAVLCGWALDVTALKRILPGLVEMKANTALAFVALGVSLWLTAAHRARPWTRPAAHAAALLAAGLGLATVFEYLLGLDLEIDQFLFRDDVSGPAFGLPPGRMAFATAANFLLLGVALLALGRARGAAVAQILAAAAGLVAVISLLGYLFGEKGVYAWSPYTSLALHTATAFTTFCVGLLAARPDAGPVAVFAGRDLGGSLARRLVPVVILVTFILGWVVHQGVRGGLYGPEFGLVLFAVLNAATLSTVVWATAGALARADRSRREAAAEREQAMAALRVEEERFRTAFDETNVAMVLTDLGNRFIRANAAFARLFGYTADEVLGLTMQDVTLPDDVGESLARREHLLAGRATYFQLEKRYRRKDGCVLWGLTNVSLVRDAGGRPLLYVAQVQDVTERKRAEDALRRAAQDLETAQQIARVGSWRWHVPTDAVTWSDEMHRIFGVTRDRFGGTLAAVLDRVLPADRPRVESVVGEAMRTGGSFHYDKRVVGPEGAVRVLHSRGQVVTNGDGHVVEMFGTAQDVTELRRLEDQLRQAQKMEAVGQLAGGVAHDFNNLLTVINGFSEMMLAGLPADDPNRALVEEVYRAGERASMLTRQLLTFSRKEVVEPRVLDLNAVVEGAARMLRRLIGEDVRLETALAPDLDRVTADPGHVEQVIMNLCVNARDAMPRGGRLTIETANVDLDAGYTRQHAGVAPGRYVLLAVSDTGHGMTPEVQARIFEPFFTTKGVGKGTGLGLATVFGIVKGAGGHVGVYSEVGRGTTFKVYLPSAGQPADAADAGPGLPELPTGAGTILVVEDDDQVRNLTRMALETLGYTVLEAGGGPEAVRLAAAHPGPIDLVVTDVVMPGMSGREVAGAVRAACPGARVLFVSGYTDDAVVRHGVLTAEMAFLQKPFTLAALGEKVRAVLDRPAGESRFG